MEMISEPDDRKFMIKFGSVWLGFFLYMFIATGSLFIFAIFLIVGFPFITYMLVKKRELYADENVLKIKKGKQLISIPLENIQNIEKFTVEPGGHRLNFKTKTVFGNYVLFLPRKASMFKKHEAYISFINKIHT